MATLKVYRTFRIGGGTSGEALSPAWRYLLLVGDVAPGRVPGWVALFQQSMPARPDRVPGWDHRPRGDRLWARHGRELEAEAATFDFTPFWVTRKTPTGDGFAEWQRRFLMAHQY